MWMSRKKLYKGWLHFPPLNLSHGEPSDFVRNSLQAATYRGGCMLDLLSNPSFHGGVSQFTFPIQPINGRGVLQAAINTEAAFREQCSSYCTHQQGPSRTAQSNEGYLNTPYSHCHRPPCSLSRQGMQLSSTVGRPRDLFLLLKGEGEEKGGSAVLPHN